MLYKCSMYINFHLCYVLMTVNKIKTAGYVQMKTTVSFTVHTVWGIFIIISAEVSLSTV